MKICVLRPTVRWGSKVFGSDESPILTSAVGAPGLAAAGPPVGAAAGAAVGAGGAAGPQAARPTEAAVRPRARNAARRVRRRGCSSEIIIAVPPSWDRAPVEAGDSLRPDQAPVDAPLISTMTLRKR